MRRITLYLSIPVARELAQRALDLGKTQSEVATEQLARALGVALPIEAAG